MQKIRNLEGLKERLWKVKTPVVGVGISAFNRTSLDGYLPCYSIICAKNSRDLEILQRDFKIISLEKIPPKERISRNPVNMLKQKEAKKFLEKLNKPYLLFYRVTEKLERVCDKNGWGLIGNRSSVFFDNKVRFRRVMEELDLPLIPGEVLKVNELNYDSLSGKYGQFAIQLQKESGGKGTFFIRGGEDFEKCTKKIGGKFADSEVLITKFIHGPSPSITGCVTKHGVLYTDLQYQLLDIPEVMNTKVGSGIFCGHDWTSSDDFPSRIKKQAYEYAEAIGNYLKGRGYKGIFGLDMIMEDGRVYVVELNPRLLGSFPVLTMAQELNREPLLIGFHILEFLNEDYEIDLKEVNRLIKKPKRGAQLILFNKHKQFAENKKSLRPGIYVVEGDEIIYLRPGYKLSDLKQKNEFIITDGVPFENTVFKPHGRILKILTLEKIMNKNTFKLNKWMKEVVGKVFEKLEMVPLGTSFKPVKQIDYYEGN